MELDDLYRLANWSFIVHITVCIETIYSSLPSILFYLVIFVYISNTVMVSEGNGTVIVCVLLSMVGSATQREFMVNLTTSNGTAMCKCLSYFCVISLFTVSSLSS